MFVVCGLNQKTPLSWREKTAIHAKDLSPVLHELANLPGVEECMALSTCHRTEIYAIVADPKILINWWKNRHQIIWPHIQDFFYCYSFNDALIHSLRVACGLDSMLIGEPQILGQLKQAYHEAIHLKVAKQRMLQWFEFVFQMTKKIRTESGISQCPVSIASVAVDSIDRLIQNLSEQRILIIGSGDTARLAAIHLQERGAHQFMVTSRHLEHAQQLASKLQGEAFVVTELNDYIHLADIVVTATSCPMPFVTKTSIQQTLLKRHHQPMILVDLAVPRDIEPEVGELSAITLIDIDSLQQIQEKNQAQRHHAGQIAETMIQEALSVYTQKNKTQRAQNVICDYRELMQQHARQEVERAHQKLTAGHCPYQLIEELSERLMQKFIHHPTLGLKKAAGDERHDILELAQYLFKPHLKETIHS